MSDQTINNIKNTVQKLYPSLFDDPDAKSQLEPLISQANIFLKQYKNQVSNKQYLLLVQFYAAHLLYQLEYNEHDINSVHVADVSFSLQNTKSNSGSNNGGYDDPYLDLFHRLLESLGFGPWSIQFD